MSTISIMRLFFAGTLSLALITSSFHTASAEALDAGTKKSERSYRKTKTGAGTLTQSMLEACIQLKAEIDEEYKKISTSKEAFDTLNNEVSDLAASLKENKKKLEELSEQDEKAYEKHNAQTEIYNKKIEELTVLETEYNEKSGPYREKAAQLEKECNGQPYYEDDYAAAVKKTGRHL